MSGSVPQVQSAIVNALRKAANPRSLILFGSRARGDDNADSDIDLLIIQERSNWKMPTRRQEIARLRQALPRTTSPVDVLLFTPEESAVWQTARNHVIAEAMERGVVLYERP
ncbi:MAG TPA: nucleotidyltransferase domain-containing protein [Lacipirellulaceae bacterium]|nr:nucleotidyltransferase domain-containing protein [Lacipirellulaceae bacterium]HMP08205.1 nucleotidyltransferase domain-containing protein [Lacipirellulaceae bacterium]